MNGSHGDGNSDKAAAAISIIGGADGPTSIFLAGKLQQTAIMGPIAVAAYSYMSLVPIIQPPIMKLLTTEKDKTLYMKRSTCCATNFPYYREITFPKIESGDMVLINGTYNRFEWIHDNTIYYLLFQNRNNYNIASYIYQKGNTNNLNQIK